MRIIFLSVMIFALASISSLGCTIDYDIRVSLVIIDQMRENCSFPLYPNEQGMHIIKAESVDLVREIVNSPQCQGIEIDQEALGFLESEIDTLKINNLRTRKWNPVTGIKFEYISEDQFSSYRETIASINKNPCNCREMSSIKNGHWVSTTSGDSCGIDSMCQRLRPKKCTIKRINAKVLSLSLLVLAFIGVIFVVRKKKSHHLRARKPRKK
jgi:hypothetical protein